MNLRSANILSMIQSPNLNYFNSRPAENTHHHYYLQTSLVMKKTPHKFAAETPIYESSLTPLMLLIRPTGTVNAQKLSVLGFNFDPNGTAWVIPGHTQFMLIKGPADSQAVTWVSIDSPFVPNEKLTDIDSSERLTAKLIDSGGAHLSLKVKATGTPAILGLAPDADADAERPVLRTKLLHTGGAHLTLVLSPPTETKHNAITPLPQCNTATGVTPRR